VTADKPPAGLCTSFPLEEMMGLESLISRVRTSGWVQLLSLLEQPTLVLSSSHI